MAERSKALSLGRSLLKCYCRAALGTCAPLSPCVARKIGYRALVPLGVRVRVTVRDPAFLEELLSNDFVFEGRVFSCAFAGVYVVPVHLCDIPV